MASTISAGTSAATAIAIAGDTSGNLAFKTQAGANTITLPNFTGTAMVSGAMPAFSVYLNGANQTIANSTDVVVLFDTVTFDTSSAYSSGSGRFQPAVAGYYQINVNIQLSGSGITLASSNILKNGGTVSIIGTSAFVFNSTPYRFSGSTLVYCNGSTDYISVSAYVTATTGNSVVIGSVFSGVLVRAA